MPRAPTDAAEIACPACDGDGTSRLLGITCQWCRGLRRLSNSRSIKYADTMRCLGGGGYIAGDLSYEDKCRMEAEADRVYALVGQGRDGDG